ncbi:hypothetical protein BJ508DRAFT_171129, partial [Ascobolus immersus RN42]
PPPKLNSLPPRLPRHPTPLYFHLRLTTTALLLLSLLLHAALLPWEKSLANTIYNDLGRDTFGLTSILALASLAPLLTINLLDLYLPHFPTPALVATDTTFGLIFLAVAVNNAVFWFAVLYYQWHALALYAFGAFVLVVQFFAVATSFAAWCLLVRQHRGQQRRRLLPVVLKRHPGAGYFRTRYGTAIAGFVCLIMTIALAAWEGYFAPLHLTKRKWSLYPAVVVSVALQLSYFIFNLLDLYKENLMRGFVVETVVLGMLGCIAGVNVVLWPVNYSYREGSREYCTPDGGYEGREWCPMRHPANQLFPYGMVTVVFLLVVVGGGAVCWWKNFGVVRRRRDERRGSVELREQ